MTKSNRLVSALALAALLPMAAAAQEQRMPQVSPSATVTQRVGLSDVTVGYHRPAVKGRKIWGDLVPYGKVWRTGANEATTITFGEDVLVEGQPLAAGTYALFTIPGEKEWTLIFDKDPKQWGAYGRKDANDALRVKVTPRSAPNEESMSFRFRDLTNTKATVVLSWERIEVPFTVQNKVDTNTKVLAMLEKKIDARKAEDWQPLTEAASYCVDNGVSLDRAAKWLDASLAVKDTTFTRFVKARLLEKSGKKAEGVVELERAVTVAGPDDDKEFIEEIRGMIASWKKQATKA